MGAVGGPEWELTSGGGLGALVVDGGGVAAFGADGLELVQHAASVYEPGLLQLWVQDRDAGTAHPLLGTGTGSRVSVRDDRLAVTGGHGDLRWRATLRLDDEVTAWSWAVEVRYTGPGTRRVDVVHAHDVALAGADALRANELYVSQYLDLTPLAGPTGTAIAVRQNQPRAGRTPWCVLACDRPVAGWATDARDVLGLYAGRAQDLPSRRLQHEHTLAVLRCAPEELAPGDVLRVTFAGLLLADHPAASGPDDAGHVAQALHRAAAHAVDDADRTDHTDDDPADDDAPHSLYTAAPALPARDLTEDELRRRHPGRLLATERSDGRVLSFFTGAGVHVVTAAKERQVLRPHGTVLRTSGGLRPDPTGLTATAWMSGSPLSYLTRGHASHAPALTTVRGLLGLHRAYGLRVFVEDAGGWALLATPSLWEDGPDGAVWLWRTADGDVTVTTSPAGDGFAVVVRSGVPRRLLVAVHGGEAAVTLRADVRVTYGDDGILFADDRPRDPATRTVLTGPLTSLRLEVGVGAGRGTGPGAASAAGPAVPVLDTPAVDGPGTDALAASLPWLVRDALVHYLSPRGLEQFTGGAWGTRDVTQGPLELLLALDRLDDARALLTRVLAAQNPDGSWPQAFGFLPGDEGFRMEPPHGDVVHWPVLAVARWLLASGDASFLDEDVPWHGCTERSSVLDHLGRALARARAGYLPGTHLVAYGHGDWNDSLQPADPALATTMTSAWTVVLHRQSLRALADGLDAAGTRAGLAQALRCEADAVTDDLREHLLVDGELAGYAVVEDGRAVRHLVHPRDGETCLTRGALQTVHALGDDLLTPDEASHHAALVRAHLLGADGLRLFDRPAPYRGGPTRHFRRAETATFVGREIGLMYVHAHLRWCEALAHRGEAGALWQALHQVLPAAHDAVPGMRPRQANTYASSSDAVVADRAEFLARYDDVLTGAAGFEGGWRVYSSGPGILVRVVTQALLGVRRRGTHVELDPVLPAAADGLVASVPLDGRTLRVRYRVGPRGHGPVTVLLDGTPLPAERAAHPYRTGGLRVALADLSPALAPGAGEGDDGGPELVVELP